MRPYLWPTKIGIDDAPLQTRAEAEFGRPFVTMVIDHKNHRLMEAVHGKSADDSRAALDHISGRANSRG